jgi:prolyl 4-hydroxylase
MNDVEEGGQTRFTDIDKEVQPKRGRAVMWPSVTDADVFQMEARTHHSAEPVVKGVKYGANAWVHLYDFRAPNHKGCTG